MHCDQSKKHSICFLTHFVISLTCQSFQSVLVLCTSSHIHDQTHGSTYQDLYVKPPRVCNTFSYFIHRWSPLQLYCGTPFLSMYETKFTMVLFSSLWSKQKMNKARMYCTTFLWSSPGDSVCYMELISVSRARRTYAQVSSFCAKKAIPLLAWQERRDVVDSMILAAPCTCPVFYTFVITELVQHSKKNKHWSFSCSSLQWSTLQNEQTVTRYWKITIIIIHKKMEAKVKTNHWSPPPPSYTYVKK